MRPMTDRHFATLRRHMVEVVEMKFDLLQDELGRDAADPLVLEAMLKVPRHLFVPEPLAGLAYGDTPLPIGFDKTISQPFIVALMTDLLDLRRGDKVLEIGTGYGYQTAILGQLADRVWSVEIVEEFAVGATERLQSLGSRAEVRLGDGCRGWAEFGPFDRILVTAAAHARPPGALIEQLSPGGRIVLPIGPDEGQLLSVIEKDDDGQIHSRAVLPVRFSRLETL